MTNQLGDSQSFRYNPQGDLIAHEDFEGHLYEYDYDEEGRLTQKTFNGQKEARYEYDENGNLLKAVNELTGKELLCSCDRKNNLTAQTTEMGTTRYTFDGRGLKTQEVRPSQIIHYTYDERGSLLISEESLLARQKVSYRYNALGQEVRRDVSGSLIEKRHYNQWGRLLGITGPKVQFDDLVGPLLYGESCTYGPGGQKIHSTDLYGQITSCEYDEFDRLAAVSYPHDAGKVYADFEERLNLGLSPGTQGSPAKADTERIEQIITQAKVKYLDYRFAEMDADSYMVPSPGGTAFRPYRNLSLSERPTVNETSA